MSDVHRLGTPRRARIGVGADGAPRTVDGRPVEAIRETWLIEDGWWTTAPLRRRYWEVVTAAGADLVVFHDLLTQRWWSQR